MDTTSPPHRPVCQEIGPRVCDHAPRARHRCPADTVVVWRRGNQYIGWGGAMSALRVAVAFPLSIVCVVACSFPTGGGHGGHQGGTCNLATFLTDDFSSG